MIDHTADNSGQDPYQYRGRYCHEDSSQIVMEFSAVVVLAVGDSYNWGYTVANFDRADNLR